MKIIILIFLLSSCSRIQFVQNGTQDFNISSSHNSESIVEIENTANFYFWGLVPDISQIELDKIFFDKGVHSPSMIQYKLNRTLSSMAVTVLSLGLFVPVPYKVQIYSAKGEQ